MSFHKECTWAEHVFNLVEELLCHQVYKALHAHHPALLLAGDALQDLILLDLVEHVSDTNSTHIDAGMTAHANTSIEMVDFSSTQNANSESDQIQLRRQAPAEGGEQHVVVSGVEASVCDDNDVDVGFGPAAVLDQVVVGVLQSGWSPRSSGDPLQALHCILNSGVVRM